MNKSLCRLKQLPKQWRKKLDEVIEALGFTKFIVDDLLYLLWDRSTLILIIVIWVNNMIISDYSLIIINYFKVQFSSHYNFKITNLGELRYILRTIFEYNQVNYFIYLSQELYFH